MQRPRRNRLPKGSYAEEKESDDVLLAEIVQDESDNDIESESADSDDEFAEDTSAVEVDRWDFFA